MLLAGGSTAIPRWTLDPVPGVGEHEAAIPGDLVAALHRRADELAVPFRTVLLAAHARVLAVLSGEPEVVTGYVSRPDGPPLPCRLAGRARILAGAAVPHATGPSRSCCRTGTSRSAISSASWA